MSADSSTGQKKSPFKKPTQDDGKGKNVEEVKKNFKKEFKVKAGDKKLPKGIVGTAAPVIVQQAKTNRGKSAQKPPAPKNNSPQPQPSPSLTSSTSPVGNCRTFADWSAAQGAPPIDPQLVTRYLQEEIKPKVDQLTKSNNSYSYLPVMYQEALSDAVTRNSANGVDGTCAIFRESVDYSQGLVQTTQSSKDEREKKEVSRTAREKEAVAKARKRGLGEKWGPYNEDLKYKGKDIFHQHVPAGSSTITAALKSQSILDAVYHTDKAFWVATQDFTLGSSEGKTEMRYYFTPAGAKSLMEDYLLCASGDFADDNEQKWAGETAHPFYTLWKANELGAYGIGASRLEELAGSVQRIEAWDSEGHQIVLDD